MPAKSKIIYLSPAADDIEDTVKYHLTAVGTESAKNIYGVLKAAIGKLADYPLLGQIHPDPVLASFGYRKLVLNKTFVAIYKIIDGNVYIYRVVNGKTDYPKLLK